ncbi:PREDICTED: uncharacterized protein LOC106751326 [Dinoponera quadriceps]|uniref:Odorant receptor n=1 Tax=Dinoponera quadriceps TaxID=609295 RepID=A0A6P3YCJ0_DINQU|nr:PREDICTED: uncharacterized protein LOC106751326 [Dinoponera quadriceps]
MASCESLRSSDLYSLRQAEKVAVTSCELEWYRLPDKKVRGIVLVMIMSNMPIKITVGKLLVLSVRTFGESQFLLRILGVWPLLEGDLSVVEMIFKIFLITICCAFVCVIVVPGFLYCLFYTEEQPHAKLTLIAPLIYSFIALAKYSTLIIYEGEIRICLRHVKDDWKFVAILNARDVMLENAKIGRNMFTVCCAMLYCAGLSFHTIVPLTKGKLFTNDNVTFRPLAFASYFILFDEQRSPAYEIMTLLQFCGGFIMYSVTIVIYGLAALLVMHACAQMKILMMLMKELVDERTCSSEKNVEKMLSIVVERQIRIRNFLYLVEDSLQNSSLFEILCCTVMMCLVGYCILMAEEAAWRTHMLGWYRLPDRKARDMMLIIIISHIPLKITAGKFIVLSFKTFGDVREVYIDS